MPRRSKKTIKAKYEKAQEQYSSLVLLSSIDISEEEWREIEEEIKRIEAMSDDELDAYYRTPEGLAEIADYRKQELELRELEARPIEERPNPLGRRLIRPGKLEFYQAILEQQTAGTPRKEIADALGVPLNTVKTALRVARRIGGQDPKGHRHRNEKEFKRCPQCRGYFNRDTRKLYGEKLDGTPELRRRHKQKETPESQLDEQGAWLESAGEENRTSYIDRQPGEISSVYNCPVCGGTIRDESDAREKHLKCANILRSGAM